LSEGKCSEVYEVGTIETKYYLRENIINMFVYIQALSVTRDNFLLKEYF